MALTDTAIRNAKPKDKPYKLADGQGLYLLINAGGSKLWRLKYRVGGIEKLLSIGPYPQVTLQEAREKALEAKICNDNVNEFPSEHVQIYASHMRDVMNDLRKIVEEWCESMRIPA